MPSPNVVAVAISRPLRDRLNLLSVQATLAGGGRRIYVRDVIDRLVNTMLDELGEEAPQRLAELVSETTVHADRHRPTQDRLSRSLEG